MSSEEKTALEILLELPSILKRMENKIDVLDTNLKILNSKLNKMRIGEIPMPQPPKPIDQEQRSVTEQTILPTATPGGALPNSAVIQPQRAQEQRDTQKLVLGNIRVFSDIKTTSGNPVTGMTINIFDSTNDLIRNLRTDANGHYECKLPPGKYTMEMIHPKLKTQNKSFELSKDAKTFEVT